MIDTLQALLGALSGALVGFSLGLVGGGGSILAVPLMVYLVGVSNPHVAIGTSALAVAANAALGLANHARAGNVKWRCGLMFAAAGVLGAFAGSTAGKAFDGQKLLFLFALVMIVVGVLMLRRRAHAGDPNADCGRGNAPRVLGYGLGTGAFSGFFGIGGGFLIVPGLIASTNMANGAYAVAEPHLLPRPRPIALDLVLERMDGRKLDLASLRGRPFVINLWASWCGPCRREMPMLIEVAKASKVPILLVNSGEDRATVRQFLRANGLDEGMVLLDPTVRVAAQVAANGYPATIFVNRSGQAQVIHVGEISRASLVAGMEDIAIAR